MYGYIYETTNLINGKKYIGKKTSSKFLAEEYLGSGRLIKQAIEKYGKENFKIKLIEECNNKEELSKREKYWISYYNAVKDNSYYNLAKGGEGWNYDHKGRQSNMKGKHLSIEHKRKCLCLEKE